MLIHKVIKGFVILKNRDDKYDPPTVVSNNWKHWKATWDIKKPVNNAKVSMDRFMP